jgi:hypothetical protein
MSNRPWRVKPSEVARLIKATQQSGLNIRNVEIGRDGLIRVNVGGPDLSPASAGETSEELRKLL